MANDATSGPATQLSILFADISDSSLMYAERGDTQAFKLTTACLDLMEEQVHLAGGRVIKRVGDAVLAVFDTTQAAVGAATGIQERLDAPRSPLRAQGIHVRAGISRGRAVLAGDDVYGDVVNVAARLVARAGPDEIFLAQRAYEDLPGPLQQAARLIDQVVLRGRPSWVTVYEYVWKQEDATVPVAVRLRSMGSALHLAYGARVFVVNSEHPKLKIGRAPDNDLPVEGDLVSRYHAEITLRGDKFFLADSSTNGTYLETASGQILRVSREDITLGDSGRILPGSETAVPIDFRVAVTPAPRSG